MGLGYSKLWTPLDALTLFCEDLTLTASDVVQMASVDRILDLVGGKHDFLWIVDISAIKISANDELYDFLLQGAPADTFASGVENLAHLGVGATEVRLGGAKDSTIGKYIVPVSSYLLSQYRHVRLNVLTAGTSETITFSSWISRNIHV